MSSILKSLRKIEEEKRGAGHAAPDLRVDQGFVPTKSKQLLPLLTGLALGAVIVGLFFLWPSKPTLPDVKNQPLAVVKKQSPTMANEVVSTVKQEPTTSGAGQEEKAVAPVTTVNSSQKTNLADQDLKAPAEPARVPVVTLSPEPVSATETNNKMTPVPASKPPLKKEQAPDVSKVASNPASTIQAPPVATVATTAAEVLSELPEGVSLLVTEIFFQKDSANSMAVVNDLPVMIGTHVDSATVTEIHPDRVLFKLGNKTYTVFVTN